MGLCSTIIEDANGSTGPTVDSGIDGLFIAVSLEIVDLNLLCPRQRFLIRVIAESCRRNAAAARGPPILDRPPGGDDGEHRVRGGL